MRVSNRLAGSLANINPDVVAVRHAARFDVMPNCRKKTPNCHLFVTRKGKEITLMPPRNNQAMSLIQREGVGKRHGEVICGNEMSASQPVTEHAVQYRAPIVSG